ncbi:hypothetical protein NWF24_14725 [Variovorax paradoxus]|uniref:hypothetical protein n=1 Tax=Variovorax paradoxus TaxID=34073 RepID=UPI0021AC4E13|nr:hypothetical protein [Variovorax paradoxus]UVH60615.1 hypothetical protein NWF24_14725 [Variovorax paradoxus]
MKPNRLVIVLSAAVLLLAGLIAGVWHFSRNLPVAEVGQANAEKVQAIGRYMHASGYIKTYRAVTELTLKSSGVSNAPLEKLRTAGDRELEAAAAEVIAPKISLVHALEIASFYESANGQEVARFQASSNADPASPREMSAQGAEAFRKFTESPAGEALEQVLGDVSVGTSVMQAMLAVGAR